METITHARTQTHAHCEVIPFSEKFRSDYMRICLWLQKDGKRSSEWLLYPSDYPIRPIDIEAMKPDGFDLVDYRFFHIQ